MLRMSAPSGDATSRRFGESLSFARAQHSSAQRTHRWSSSASVFTPPDARGLASESAPFGPASQADDRRVLIAWPMIGAFRSADVAFPQSQDRRCTPRRRRSFRLCVSYRSGRKRCHSDGKATALRIAAPMLRSSWAGMPFGKRVRPCGCRPLIWFALDLARNGT